MAERNHGENRLSAVLRKGLELVAYFGSQLLSYLRLNTERTRHQVRDIFYSTSDQVLEKAEETRKAVGLRMAILEIEHHLNRLYPQIGKLTCDLVVGNPQSHDVMENEDLKAKVELAQEYRGRLSALKGELEEHQQRSKERHRQ